MLKRSFTLLAVGLLSILYSQAQNQEIVNDSLPALPITDTLPVIVDEALQLEIEENSSFLDNLDSITQLWYVQKALAALHTDGIYYNADDSIRALPAPEVSDSLFIARLANIESIVDLTYNDRVKAYLNVYTKKEKDKVEIMLGLADYYFPLFEQILIDEGLPVELKYLPVIESALNPKAVSRVGATGLWQFMYSTGKMYNLEINSQVDERRDPIQSSYAAAHFLKDLYEMFGDWTLALAAYNCGPGNVRKAIRRTGGKTNFWDIYYKLPRETRGYVPAFIAATYTMNYYKEHNMVPRKIEIPLTTDTIMIAEPLHLKQVSEVLNIPISLLRNMNPQYKQDVIPAKKKTYALRIPTAYSFDFIELEDSILAYKDDVYFSAKNKLKEPTHNAYYGAPPKNSIKLTYVVKPGDNLGYISSWYNVGLSDLKHWNNVYRNLIREGQKLNVYVPKSKKSYYSKVNKLSFSEKQARIGKKATDDKKESNPKPTPDTGNYVYYTVKRGDNLWEIAKKFPGVSHTDIQNLNNISNHRNIKVGQKLKIKSKA